MEISTAGVALAPGWRVGGALAGTRERLTELRLSARHLGPMPLDSPPAAAGVVGGGAAGSAAASGTAVAVVDDADGGRGGAGAGAGAGELTVVTVAADIFGGRSLEIQSSRGPDGRQASLAATVSRVPGAAGGDAAGDDADFADEGGSGWAWGLSAAQPLGPRLTAFARFFAEDYAGRQVALQAREGGAPKGWRARAKPWSPPSPPLFPPLALTPLSAARGCARRAPQAVVKLSERDSLSALLAANLGSDASAGFAWTRRLGRAQREQLSLRALAALSGGYTLALALKRGEFAPEDHADAALGALAPSAR